MNTLSPLCRRSTFGITLTILLLCFLSANAAEPKSTSSPQSFRLKPNDHVALVGATFIERDRHYGYLETMLRIHHPGLKLSFRNMAWPGDTTHTRLRPLNYGSFEENLAKEKPTVVIASYGVNDSFEGPSHLEPFIAGYKSTLDIFAKLKLRTLLVSPPPFENITSAPYQLDSQNVSLNQFVNATGKLAEEQNVSFINLFQPLKTADSMPAYPLTDNGLHLTEAGYWKVSQVLADQMGLNNDAWAIEITAGKRKVTKSGLRIRNVQSNETGVQFSAIDNHLPLAPPNTTSSGANLSLNRQLTVKGLTPGNYALSIDGVEITTASAGKWEQGVNINNGPQFDQTRQLRETVQLKNKMFFHKWRAHNGEYIYGRRASVSENWDATKDGGNSGNPSFIKEMAKFAQLIKESEQKANKLSKPLSHNYVLIQK